MTMNTASLGALRSRRREDGLSPHPFRSEIPTYTECRKRVQQLQCRASAKILDFRMRFFFLHFNKVIKVNVILYFVMNF